MKIAQIVCTLPPDGGGIGVVAHYYAAYLTRRGHQVDVFVPSNRAVRGEEINYRIIPLRPVFKYGYGAILPQLLWRLRSYDIIHLHLPFLGATFFFRLLKLISRKKLKLAVSYHMDLVGAGWKKKVFNFYKKISLFPVLKIADAIIVSSLDYTVNSDIGDFYQANKKKFYEIPFGASRIFSPKPKRPDLMEKYHIQNSDLVLGFVGGLDSAHYFKGVDQLIKALPKIQLPAIKVLIVGKGNLTQAYRDLAAKLGFADKVIFAGYVPKSMLPEHYNLFDIFILPSVDQSEAFGLVLIEAMACGKPLIASNLKGVRSVVVPGQNGLLIEPRNPDDIAAKVNYLLDNPRLLKQFSANGLARVEQKYRWRVVAEKLDKLYSTLT